MFVGGAAGVEGAEEVDVDDAFEGVGGHADGGRGEVTGRGADDDFDLAELFAGVLDGLGDGGVVADVDGGGGDGGAGFAHNFGGRFELVVLASGDGYVGSVLGETFRDALANAATAAGDEGGLALEEEIAEDAGRSGGHEGRISCGFRRVGCRSQSSEAFGVGNFRPASTAFKERWAWR